MSMPMPPNVSVDIYRNADPGNPYSPGSLSASGVKGYLQPAVQHGRFGTALYLKWMHILFLPPGTDVRDAYNSQLDPARDDTLADTIMLTDSQDASKQTAWFVVFIEEIARGTTLEHLRVYLDRFTPNDWPTDAL